MTIANRQLVRSLRQHLDPGEAEAIALAVEIEADHQRRERVQQRGKSRDQRADVRNRIR